MVWGNISLFAGFLEKQNSLETLIVIFEEVSPYMKNFEIAVLTANYRYLQTAGFENILCDGDVYRSIFASPENTTLFG